MSHSSEVGTLPLSIGRALRLSRGSKPSCFVHCFFWRLARAAHRLIIRVIRAPFWEVETTTPMTADLIRLGRSVRRLNSRVFLQLDSGSDLILTTSQIRPQSSCGPHFDLSPAGK
jgi:hypothetical protein